MMLRTLLATILLISSSPLAAAPKVQSELRQIEAGQPAMLKPDRAYVILRIDTSLSKFTANLLRIPGADEIAAYETAKAAAHAKAGKKAGPIETFAFDYQGRPNFYELNPKKPFTEAPNVATVFAEIPPGEYVFYGEGFGGFLYQCFCLGTVGFSATPGRVIDLGTMLIAKAWETSNVPELAGEAGLGPIARMDYGLFAVALRPARPADTPAGIEPRAIDPAQFHAVGPFLEANTVLINRLAPIPGVLAYDGGRVIDVASGKEAPPNFPVRKPR